jgi:hypothetical protein
MPKYVVSYDVSTDVPDAHPDVSTALKAAGWTIWMPKRLPSTTLIGDFPDHRSAVQAFLVGVTDAENRRRSALVTKYLVVEWTEQAGTELREG